MSMNNNGNQRVKKTTYLLRIWIKVTFNQS
jgi:hypothetical protein